MCTGSLDTVVPITQRKSYVNTGSSVKHFNVMSGNCVCMLSIEASDGVDGISWDPIHWRPKDTLFDVQNSL
jgi:hypothetical protein